MRTWSVTTLFLALSTVWAQSEAPPFAYESFLREVVSLGSGGQRILANGQPTPEVIPNPQTVLGWEDAEWSRLRSVAEECAAESARLDAAERPIAFDLRIALAAGQDVSPLRQRIAVLEAQRARMLQQALELLRREPKFAELNSFIATHTGQASYFVVPSGRPILKAR